MIGSEQCRGLLSSIALAAEKAPIELRENPTETSLLCRVLLGVTFKISQLHLYVKVLRSKYNAYNRADINSQFVT